MNEQAIEKPFANVVGLEPNTFYKFGLYGRNGTEKGEISWIMGRTLGEDVRQFPGTRYPDKSGFASLVVLPDELEHWWDDCAYVLTLDLQVFQRKSFSFNLKGHMLASSRDFSLAREKSVSHSNLIKVW